jgi:hypothetical protein
MRIKNPTDVNISVVVMGSKYSINANGILSNVSEVHAKYWRDNIHNFLQLSEDGVDNLKDVEEVKDTKTKLEEEMDELEIINDGDITENSDEAVEEVKVENIKPKENKIKNKKNK